MNIPDPRFNPYTNPTTLRALLGPEAGPETSAEVDAETGGLDAATDGTDTADLAATEDVLREVYGKSSAKLAVASLMNRLRPETHPEHS